MAAERTATGGDGLPLAARRLLAGIIDYAGLFPPAALGMAAAVKSYASYRASADGWALGRFIVPAGRLEEMADAVATLGPRGSGADRWRLSALVDPGAAGELERIRVFNEAASGQARGGMVVDTVEIRLDDAAGARSEVREWLAEGLTVHVEIPLNQQIPELVADVLGAGARAKVRTGGTTAGMIPPPEALLAFLRACVERDLPFKATAGLHHPVAGRYPLTYAADSAVAAMYGFLNLLAATALLRRGASQAAVEAALSETDGSAFQLSDEALWWREHRVDLAAIEGLRERALVSFGSCSFREPLDELRGGAVRLSTDAPEPAAGP